MRKKIKRLLCIILSLVLMMWLIPMMLTSCNDGIKKEEKVKAIIKDPISASLTEEHAKTMSQLKKTATAQYGENKKITDGNYDESLAAKCVNGTFVGKKVDNTIVYRGIPFVGEQPVGKLRWKAPVDAVPDDGVYEAYYNGKCAPQREVEYSSAYIQGEDCLYLNIWKANDTSTEQKPRLCLQMEHGLDVRYAEIPLLRFPRAPSSPRRADPHRRLCLHRKFHRRPLA